MSEPNPVNQPLPPATQPNQADPDTLTIDDDAIAFEAEPLGDRAEDAYSDELIEGKTPQVVPFTTEEVLNGTLANFLVASTKKPFNFTPEEAQIFEVTWKMHTEPSFWAMIVLETLDIGGALADFGIGKDTPLHQVTGFLVDLPSWLRLILGGIGISYIISQSTNAVMKGRGVNQTRLDKWTSRAVGGVASKLYDTFTKLFKSPGTTKTDA